MDGYGQEAPASFMQRTLAGAPVPYLVVLTMYRDWHLADDLELAFGMDAADWALLLSDASLGSIVCTVGMTQGHPSSPLKLRGTEMRDFFFPCLF